MKPLSPQIIKKLQDAVDVFWGTRTSQKSRQEGRAINDQGNRGSVTGGKQLNGFIDLLAFIATEIGIPTSWIYTKGNQLPGFFRPTKDWDFLIIAPDKQLLVVVEFKSQVGSFGNNFNNRTEEALGSALDLWTAYREKAYPNLTEPWVGYVMIAEKSKGSTSPVRIKQPYYEVFPEFRGTSYLDRYRIFCEKLVLERHYTASALIWTSSDQSYGSVEERISIENFLQAYITYLKGKREAYE
jgi:Restriction endonuclease XhoI